MESLNKVELVGMVGNVRSDHIGESNIYRFSIATSYAYRDREGSPVIETTWHNCTYFSKEEKDIKRGDNLRVFGRIQAQKYIDITGKESETYRILVNRIESIKKTIL